MIRFSAALVAVAIGVLLGGIATSKLLLVYIAIVVSAVALVALAIGVVLKREELFGDEQGLVPAPAGASPVLSARADESQGKVPAGAHVAPPPPYAGAAAGYAAFGGNTPSAPAGVDRSGRPAPSGQGRSAGTASARPTTANPVPANPVPAGTVSANPVLANTGSAGAVPPWEATPARGPWSSSAADWMPSGQDERAAGAGTQGGRAGGWRSAE
ncbi:MAG TPA: hypothetical protein VK817_20175, partial [Trebonia sp.]|nr:hypothetical protein [Trebonia sp.]